MAAACTSLPVCDGKTWTGTKIKALYSDSLTKKIQIKQINTLEHGFICKLSFPLCGVGAIISIIKVIFMGGKCPFMNKIREYPLNQGVFYRIYLHNSETKSLYFNCISC